MGCSIPGIVVQLLIHIGLFVILWTVARQASLSFAVSPSLLKLMSIESVMPPNHLVLCHPLLLLLPAFPSIRAFSSELALRIRWPEYWRFSPSSVLLWGKPVPVYWRGSRLGQLPWR